MSVTAPSPGPRDGNDVILAVLIVGFGAAATLWAALSVSSLIWHRQPPDLGLGDTIRAVPGLVDHADRPAAAFDPDQGPIAPAGVVWPTVAVFAAAVTVAAAKAAGFLGVRVGTAPRRRLGTDVDARLARPRDLAPLIVQGPTPGRLILGRVGRRLVATEHRDPNGATGPTNGRAGGTRRGDRSAVAVIGPTRCGKTANTISGILEWEGPAVLSSVKADVLHATIERRAQLGDVAVFDPAGLSGFDSCGWSPLRGADSAVDAMKRSQHLLDALATDPGSNIGFFKAMADQLLWPMLFAAAVDGAPIADVVRWVSTQDRPHRDQVRDLTGELRPSATSEVATILTRHLASTDPQRHADARLALNTLEGIWTTDDRTRGNTYSTASALIRAWADPTIARVAAIEPAVDLDWLLAGNNTLYVVAPEHDFSRLAVVYGALFGDLFTQAYEHTTRHRQPLDPTLLFVLDEAAQTPVEWLPTVASTCAGIGILLVTIWQSIAQMHTAFGHQADTVLTNHGSKLFFSGISDPATLDYVRNLIGDEDVHTRSASADLGGGARRSMSDATTRLPLIAGDTLRRAPVGDALLLHGTLPPAHLHSRPWHTDKTLRRLAHPHEP